MTLADKQVVLLVGPSGSAREPRTALPKLVSLAFRTSLAPGAATLDDCPTIRAMLGGRASSPAVSPPLVIGYLVIRSPSDLTVDAIYTSVAPGLRGSRPTGIAEQVLRVPGKQVLSPFPLSTQ